MRPKTALFIAAYLIAAEVQANVGLLGGFTNNMPPTPYAALVLAADGSTQFLSGYPTNGAIFSVGFNVQDLGLLGGVEIDTMTMTFVPYVSHVAADGTLTRLTSGSLPLDGAIFSVSLNPIGIGLIGGQAPFQSMASDIYAAKVMTDGSIQNLNLPPLPPMSNTAGISWVAINSSEVGLVGGQYINSMAVQAPYAALIFADGTTQDLSSGANFPVSGNIGTVAINDLGLGLIGGRDLLNNSAYASFVESNGTLIQIPSGGFPVGMGSIVTVGINISGVGLIGGLDAVGDPYAARVQFGGALQTLSDAVFPQSGGGIGSVSINSAGMGVIGGRSNNLGYVGLVSPDGTLTSISDPAFFTANLGITSVSINEEGVSLIGGLDTMTSTVYAALIAPNGALTSLQGFPLMGALAISVATSRNAFFVGPTSIGPYTGQINTLLAASKAVENHMMTLHKKLWREEETENGELGYVVQSDFERNPMARVCCPKPSSFTFWVSPFFDKIHQSKQEEIPSFTNDTYGLVSGLDYWATDSIVLGGSLAYAFNYTHFSESLGHAKTNQEMAVYYTSYQGDFIFVDASVWGGFYEIANTRHTLGFITSKSNSHGWLLSPHFEICATNYRDLKWWLIEPFAMVDWVNNWQHGYKEKGASGLNLVIEGQYNSLLRSEAGLRFYEVLNYEWGRILLEEKGSYINRAPFHFNPTTTFFVASPSTFTVETGTNQMQNLVGAQLNAAFVPWNDRYPYGQIDFRGEFGSSFISYFASFEIGKKF